MNIELDRRSNTNYDDSTGNLCKTWRMLIISRVRLTYDNGKRAIYCRGCGSQEPTEPVQTLVK